MLEIKDLCWKAPDGKQVLSHVNLKIGDNRLVAITGPNGGGKTTLARAIAGMEENVTGRLILDGEDITGLDVTERARKGISFAFQQPVRFKGITVKNLLETAAGSELDRDGLCVILQKVGLCARNYLDREVDSTLSGGEIKRIEIASVLARHTKLSVFDEPEAGIDLWSFQNLIEVFEEMRRNLKGTLVIISHQERILKIADEIVMLADGQVKDRGPGPEMMAKMLASSKQEERRCHRKELF